MDSMAAVAAKAQHDPHACWSRTGVTIPALIQLTDPEVGTEVGILMVLDEAEEVSGAEGSRAAGGSRQSSGPTTCGVASAGPVCAPHAVPTL